jgi:hypothetical protein
MQTPIASHRAAKTQIFGAKGSSATSPAATKARPAMVCGPRPRSIRRPASGETSAVSTRAAAKAAVSVVLGQPSTVSQRSSMAGKK